MAVVFDQQPVRRGTFDERTYGEPSCVRCLFTDARPHPAANAADRPVVAVAAADRFGLRRICHLCDLPGFPAELLLRPAIPLPDAVLLALLEQSLRRSR